MAGDSTSARTRSGSGSGTSRNLPGRPKSGLTPTPLQKDSTHVADPFLSDFLDPSFNPVVYLNSVLPPLQTSSSSSRSSATSAARQTSTSSTTANQSQKPAAAVPLSELSSQAQAHINQLNVHTTRLAATLTQLTDDILRSGSRLAYEVELLRGETLGLAEMLTEGLHDDVAKFVPGGVDGEAAREGGVPKPSDPPHIAQLRTLALVRSRLESVIKTFGEAMEFVFPPSEVSVGSSFLSVSAPDPGKEAHSTEEKGQQVLRDLRDEISRLLAAADPEGIEDAVRRVEQLKELNRVWNGTAEEKGRTKFLESLAKLIEDRHRDLLRELEQSKQDNARSDSVGSRGSSPNKKITVGNATSSTESKGYGGGYGFISQLQKIRGGL